MHRHDQRVLDRLPVVVPSLAHDLKADALVHRTRRRVARAHLQDGQTRAARRGDVERRTEQCAPDALTLKIGPDADVVYVQFVGAYARGDVTVQAPAGNVRADTARDEHHRLRPRKLRAVRVPAPLAEAGRLLYLDHLEQIVFGHRRYRAPLDRRLRP